MTEVFPPRALPAYALLDSGAGQKLERFGDRVLARPDPQALWRPRLEEREWRGRADLVFVRESDRGGRWETRAGKRVDGEVWRVDVLGASVEIRPTPFKHVGLFPEQATNWSWLEERRASLGAKPELLNLFGYTGAASLIAARAGFDVTHVDASKTSLAWARANAEASGLEERAVRWVLDDALGFARREVRRKRRYAGVLLDPPHFGRGPKGETWRLEEGLAPLLEACAELLADESFLILSTYAVGYSPLTFENVLGELPGGRVSARELVLAEEELPDVPSRRLPCGFCARWLRGGGELT